jgi:hypothetical protein
LKIFADASPSRRGPTLTLTNYQLTAMIVALNVGHDSTYA